MGRMVSIHSGKFVGVWRFSAAAPVQSGAAHRRSTMDLRLSRLGGSSVLSWTTRLIEMRVTRTGIREEGIQQLAVFSAVANTI